MNSSMHKMAAIYRNPGQMFFHIEDSREHINLLNVQRVKLTLS